MFFIIRFASIGGFSILPKQGKKSLIYYTVIHFVSSFAKFGICAVVGPNGSLVEDKMRTF
jgi:hypothetical protein